MKNTNITEVFYKMFSNKIGAHYEYSPFGKTVVSTRNTSLINTDICTENPFRFSSEYHDDALGLIYYNYRHYNPQIGRWISRDPIEEQGGNNLYGMCKNNLINNVDLLGEDTILIGAGAAIGTTVCPGAGTIIGATVGAAVSACVAWWILDKCKPKKPRKICLPCQPVGVGGISYRIDVSGKSHNGIPTPHSHQHVMMQSPPENGCQCFWHETLKNPLKGYYFPTMVPASGGGVTYV